MQTSFKTFNKDLEEMQNEQAVTKNTITEIKNTVERFNSRITEAEQWISEVEGRMVEIAAEELNKEQRIKRIKGSLRDL